MAYGVIRLDKVKATAHLESITCASNLENGMVGVLSTLAADGESRTVVAQSAITNRVVLHASVPTTYAVDALEEDFILTAGKVGRGYVLEKGDIVTFCDSVITGTTVVGEFLAPTTSGFKLAAKASLTTEVFAMEVIEKTTLNGAAATVGRVILA